MTQKEVREVALDGRVSKIDALARDAGHAPEAWEYEHGDGYSRASTTCECGAQACVRVRQDDKTIVEWQGGRLAWAKGPEQCPITKEETC